MLCNVASAVETRRGLAAGAAGVGLLRTELPYTQAADWPTLAQDRDQLGPILELLADRTAIVRLLDFSGDKIPPFLGREAGGAVAEELGGAVAEKAGAEITLPAGAGLAALLAHPSALADQLRAILETGRDARLGVLIPMVSSLREVSRVREVLTETAAALGVATPPLGIMVELESTAANAAAFAPAVDFFSIGTNDLTGDVLGLGRRDQAAGPALAAHPRVLALVKGVAKAGREAGITVSVCGDSAADARVLPLLDRRRRADGERAGCQSTHGPFMDIEFELPGLQGADRTGAAGIDRGRGVGPGADAMRASAQRRQHRSAAARAQVAGDGAGGLNDRAGQLGLGSVVEDPLGRADAPRSRPPPRNPGR